MDWIKQIIRLIAVFLIQILLINNLQLLGVCRPFVYILFLIMLPTRLPHWIDMIIGLTVGLIMDIFCNSVGIHMAACVLIMFIRRFIIRNLIMDYERITGEISSQTIGIEAFIKYAMALIVFHHSAVFILSAWSLSHFWLTLLEILVSSLISMTMIIGYDLTKK